MKAGAKTTSILARAAECQERGDLAGAARRYREYLRAASKDAEAWHALGGVEFQRGQITDAIRALKKAVALQPSEHNYLNDLAGLYLTQGQFSEAEEICHELLRANPDYLPASYNLALAYSQRGRHHEAVEILRGVIERQPDWAAAHYNLGVALMELGDHESALLPLKMAAQLQPYFATGHIKLAQTLRQLAFYHSAIDHFRRGLEIEPDNIDAIIDLAGLLADDGQISEAIQLLETAHSRHSGISAIPAALGVLYHRTGDARRAEFWFDAALKIDPVNAEAVFGKAQVRRYAKEDVDLIQSFEKRLHNTGMAVGERSSLHFALGKMLDDIGDYDKAFSHFQLANDMIKQISHYDRQVNADSIDNTIRLFTREFIDALASTGSASDLPIFVVGMPRSGTTLAEQIIASHPQAHGAGELVYFQSIVNRLPQLLRSNQPNTASILTITPEVAAQITGNYLALLRRHSTSALRVVNKMPYNYALLGFISGLFPNAKIIHCMREPLDICLSIYFQSFKEGNSYSWDLLDIGHYYLLYARLMRHWRTVIPDRFLDLNYEELVEKPEESSRRLIEYCGLDWHDQCLRFYETKREVKTASIWQVRQPIYKTSAKRWEHYAKYLAPLRELLAGESA